MREGWGVTHDYVKDEQNLWRLYHAINKGEKNLDELFKKGRVKKNLMKKFLHS